ncbi:hypothetical protein ACQBAR_01240 [Propionibacteriaceae bacterium Y1685]
MPGPRWRSLLVRAVVTMVAVTACVALAHWGLLRDKSYDRIPDAVGFGHIGLGLVGALWPWVVFEHEREDSGFPVKGLVPWTLVTGPLVGLLGVGAAATWPLITGQFTLSGSVQEPTTPQAALTLLFVVWATTNAGLATGMPIFASVAVPRGALICVLPWLGTILAGCLAVHTLGDEVADAGTVAITASAVLITALLLIASCVLTTWFRPNGVWDERRRGPLRTTQEIQQLRLERQRRQPPPGPYTGPDRE